MSRWVRIFAAVGFLGSTSSLAFSQPAVVDGSSRIGMSVRSGGIEDAARKAGDSIIPSCKFAGGRCGYIDQTGKTVIEPQFDSVERFREGRAVVVADGLYGAIDQTGRFAVPARFPLMSVFSDGLAQVLIDGKLGVVDKDGNWVLPAEYGGIVRLSPNAFLVGEPPYRESRMAGREHLAAFDDGVDRYHPPGHGRWGVVARGGAWLVRPTYLQVMPLSDELNGLFWASNSPSSKVEWRLRREDGTTVMDEAFAHVQWVQKGQDRAIVAGGERPPGDPNAPNRWRWGAVDSRGNLVVPLKYDWLSYYRDGYSMYKLNGKEGRIDQEGNVLSEGSIQPSILDRDVRLAAVVDGKSLFTDKANTKLLGTERPRCPDGRHLRFESGLWKVVGADEIAVDLAFEWVHLACAGHSLVKKDGRWGYLTAEGKILGDSYYDHANPFHGGIATVTQDRLWGVIDEEGKFLLGPLKLARGAGVRGDGAAILFTENGDLVLDKAAVAELARDPDALTRPLPPRRLASEGLAASYDENSKKWGFVDANGAYTIPPQFDAVGNFSKGTAWAAFPGKQEWCLIDKGGNARPDRRCQCEQPLVIVEHYSPPANLPCYAAGLAVVGVRK